MGNYTNRNMEIEGQQKGTDEYYLNNSLNSNQKILTSFRKTHGKSDPIELKYQGG